MLRKAVGSEGLNDVVIEHEAKVDKELAEKVFLAGIEASNEVIESVQEVYEASWSHLNGRRGPELKGFIGATGPVVVLRESVNGMYDLNMTFVDPIETGDLNVLFSEDSEPFRKTQISLYLTKNCPSSDEIRQGVDINPYVTAMRFEEGIEANVGTSKIEREESASAYRVATSGGALSGIALRHGGHVEVDVDAEVKLSGSQSLDDGQRYGVVKGGRSPLSEGVSPEDIVTRVLGRFDKYLSS